MFLTESDEVEQAVLSKNTLTVLHLNCMFIVIYVLEEFI